MNIYWRDCKMIIKANGYDVNIVKISNNILLFINIDNIKYMLKLSKKGYWEETFVDYNFGWVARYKHFISEHHPILKEIYNLILYQIL